MSKVDQKTRFIELRALGTSYNKIADELSVSKQTLINWSKELKLELANLESLRLDELRQKYCRQKETRLQVFSDALEKIRDELKKRDLGDVPTHKLIELAMKCAGMIDRETPEIMFRKDREFSDSLYDDSVSWPA